MDPTLVLLFLHEQEVKTPNFFAALFACDLSGLTTA